MKSKLLTAFFIVLTIGAYLNAFIGLNNCSGVTNLQNWDVIKVVIDFLVASAWTLLTVRYLRRK